MEQQIREKAASAAGLTAALPSIATLSSYAQSPRAALPLVASAAWGNLQKAGKYGSSALSEIAQNYSNQTPSKSTASSPGSWMSGIMTPPNTTARTPLPSDSASMPPPAMRPLAAAARKIPGGPAARPLRAYNNQPRALSARKPMSIETGTKDKSSDPQTPPSKNKERDSLESQTDFSEDVDDDASPLDGKESRRLAMIDPSTEE